MQVVVTPHWLDRYLSGQHSQVWSEMTGVGVEIRRDEYRQEAVAVATETMKRARKNVEQLIDELPKIGSEFKSPREQLLVPPGPNIAAELDNLEARIGLIPISLRAWLEQVGSVNLMGGNPRWAFYLTDPLIVDAPLAFVLSEYEEWLVDRETAWSRGSFRISIAPDALHKADVSGGAPYELDLPNEAADGLLLGEPSQTTFVNYLRHAFAWAGLPGWDPTSQLHHLAPIESAPSEVPRLAKDLLAI